jgi:hypothetical protein
MPRAVETLVWWAVLVGVWLTTLSSMNGQDLAVAAVLAVPCALAATAVRAIYGLSGVRKAVKTIVVSSWPTSVVLDDKDDTLLVHPLRRR